MSDNKRPISGDVMPDKSIFVGIDPTTGKGLSRTFFAGAQTAATRESLLKSVIDAEGFDFPTPEQAEMIKKSVSGLSTGACLVRTFDL